MGRHFGAAQSPKIQSIKGISEMAMSRLVPLLEFNQARKNSFVQNEGYHISLKTILEERGLSRETRLWDNLKSVREALTEMKKRRILSEMQSFDEELIHAPSKGRPKIVDAIWTLYASAEFVDEIIGGNKQMKQAQRVGGTNEGGSQLLPGFQESRGK